EQEELVFLQRPREPRLGFGPLRGLAGRGLQLRELAAPLLRRRLPRVAAPLAGQEHEDACRACTVPGRRDVARLATAAARRAGESLPLLASGQRLGERGLQRGVELRAEGL